MPTENRSSNADPRDVFIRLNPLGLGEAELRKDSTGFEDQRTHSDYLLFLAGYRETHPEPQHHTNPGEVERLRAELGAANAAMYGECEKLRAQLAALRELKLPHYLKLSDEMRAAGDHAEQRAREDQCYSVPVLKAVFFEAAIQRWLDDQEEAISASAEPSALVEIDERAEFEAFFTEKAKNLPLLHGATTLRYPGGQYVGDWALFGFIVWQARADLHRKP